MSSIERIRYMIDADKTQPRYGLRHARRAAWCAVAAALGTLTGEAHAQADSLEVRLSGHVSRAILRADDGVADAWFHVDNSSSSTRLRINAYGTISSGLRAGALLEVDYQSNPSSQVNFATREVSAQFLERHIDVYFSGGWGTVRFGQGDGAATRAAEVDLSGTALALDAPARVGGAFAYRTSAGALSGVAIRNSINNQNFEMRYDRIRYSTPSFAGLWGEASWGNKDNYVAEAALRYAGTLAGLGQLAGAIGCSNEKGTPGLMDDKVVGGSLSWLHASGINLTYGQARRGLPDRDAGFHHFKLGYRWSRHAAAVDYAEGVDQAALGDEAKMVGVAYVYAPVGWAEFYAMWKRHILERPAESFQAIQLYMMGTRLRF